MNKQRFLIAVVASIVAANLAAPAAMARVRRH